jgi:purine-nucleoside/S-methyl-5'-thioadenosine phosphorylase / adenosine deaminase
MKTSSASAVTANLAWRGELLPGVHVAITGRRGGVSKPPHDPLNLGLSIGDDPAAVSKNRQLVAQECGIGTGQMVWMRQVHGAHASYARPGEAIKVADALYTDLPGVVLSVLAGDCAPVLIADPGAGVVGAAHAGRGGMQAGVVPALVKAMTGVGGQPERMHALVGPVICGGCYGVPAGLQAQVADAVPQARCVTRSGDPGLDIRAGITAQLAGLGVCHVRQDRRCTAETDDLSSHRRDGQAGRFAALIWRER